MTEKFDSPDSSGKRFELGTEEQIRLDLAKIKNGILPGMTHTESCNFEEQDPDAYKQQLRDARASLEKQLAEIRSGSEAKGEASTPTHAESGSGDSRGVHEKVQEKDPATRIFEEIGLSHEFVEDTVEGFDEMSESQQLLLAEQMRQIARGNVEDIIRKQDAERATAAKAADEEKAAEKANKKRKKEKGDEDPDVELSAGEGESPEEGSAQEASAASRVFQKMTHVAKNIPKFARNVFLKPSDEAGNRKQAETYAHENAEREYGEILKLASQGIRNSEHTPDVYQGKDGKINISVLSNEEIKDSLSVEGELTEAQQREVENLSLAAQKFTKMPKEWSYEDAKLVDKRRYQKAERKYNDQKEAFLRAFGTEKLDDKTVQMFARVERDVRLLQLVNTDPDMGTLFGRLSHAVDNNKYLAFLKNQVIEKGSYVGLGYYGRQFLGATFGFVGAPAAAGVAGTIGGFRSLGRARKELRKKRRAGEAGESKQIGRDELLAEYNTLKDQEGKMKQSQKKRFDALRTLLFVNEFDEGLQEYIPERNAWMETEWDGTRDHEYPGPANEENREKYMALMESYKAERERRNTDEKYAEERRKAVVKAHDLIYGAEKTFAKAGDAENPETGVIQRGLVTRLREKIDAITSTSDDEERKKAIVSLELRFQNTKDKLDAGLVEFGTGAEKRRLQVDLLQAISDAEAILALYSNQKIEYGDGKMDPRERIESILKLNDEKLSEARRKHLLKQSLKGAAISAGFGAMGAVWRWFHESGAEEKAEALSGGLLPAVDESSQEAGTVADSTEAAISPSAGASPDSTGVTGDVTEQTPLKEGDAPTSEQPNVRTEEGEAPVTGGGGSSEQAVEKTGSADAGNEAPEESSSGAEAPPVPAAEAVNEANDTLPENFTVRAERGDGLTHLARKATSAYLEAKGEGLNGLTAEHLVWIEDSLRRQIEFSGTLHPGDSVEIGRDAIEKAIAESQDLTEAQLENLTPYADRVSAFDDLPRAGDVESPVEDAANSESVEAGDAAPSPETYSVSAEFGEGVTHLARRAITDYLGGHPDTSLSAGQLVYVEDALTDQAVSGLENPDIIPKGESFDFSAADIAQTIEEAKELSAEELANLEPYADRVSAFDELPRVGDLELSGSNTSQSSAMEAYFIDNPDGIKAFIEVRDALSEMLDGPGKSGSFVNDSIRPSEQIAGIGSMFLEGNTTSEYEYPFGQFLVTTYEKLHDDVMKTNPEEARQLLFPDSEDSMKSYVERISFMLMKTRITPESFKDAMDKVESEGILDFLKDQKLIEYEDVEQKLAA